MELLYIILYIAAAISFVLGIGPVPWRVNWIALGLLFWVLVPLIQAVKAY